VVRDGLKIQQRFSAAPVYGVTGKGLLQSEGVETLQRIKRNLVDSLKLKADQAHVIRTLLGHVVAGTASEVETKELRAFSRGLRQEQLKKHS
jgi:hypothetical protein